MSESLYGSVSTLFESPRVQISSSTIRKCLHGIYWPEGQTIPYACSFCNPALYSGDGRLARKFVLPPMGMSLSDAPERLYANGGAASGRCPKCRSHVHSVSETSSRVWICCDCSEDFPAPKGRK
jgi:hypothetical protein